MHVANLILLAAAAASAVFAAPATTKCPTSCPASFIPACASNGKTFAGDCELQQHACKTGNASLFNAHPLACTPAQVEAKDGCYENCPASFAPVCGSDGVSYSGECELRVAACRRQGLKTAAAATPLYVAQSGAACTKDQKTKKDGCYENCPPSVMPVCGSNGQSYASACVVRVEACRARAAFFTNTPSYDENGNGIVPTVTDELFVAHPKGCTEEQQLARDGCFKTCPQSFMPVCGSNGKLFAGECEMEIEACKTRTAISKVDISACRKA
ncbi:hypothetical protein HDU96_003099 [Phlyctochytrium bullatum]|nr:hypothetical protein HDU96_003099 [Phlyctochytrium bullatum]